MRTNFFYLWLISLCLGFAACSSTEDEGASSNGANNDPSKMIVTADYEIDTTSISFNYRNGTIEGMRMKLFGYANLSNEAMLLVGNSVEVGIEYGFSSTGKYDFNSKSNHETTRSFDTERKFEVEVYVQGVELKENVKLYYRAFTRTGDVYNYGKTQSALLPSLESFVKDITVKTDTIKEGKARISYTGIMVAKNKSDLTKENIINGGESAKDVYLFKEEEMGYSWLNFEVKAWTEFYYCAYAQFNDYIIMGDVLSWTKDDNDDNNDDSISDSEVLHPEQTAEAIMAWRWISVLTDESDQAEDWQNKRYTATIGMPSSNNSTTRLIIVSDLEEAEASFASIADCQPAELRSSKTVSAGELGSMTWSVSPQYASNIATVEVDCSLLPQLSKIIYCTEEQTPDNAFAITGNCYYRLGDVIEDNEGFYWVCVKPSFLGMKATDSYWVNIFNASEEGRGYNTQMWPGFPAKNVYTRHNKKYNSNTILLPTNLKFNRLQNYNLANLVWALLNPALYKGIVEAYGKGLCGFAYEYHGENYLTSVANYWKEEKIWEKLFNRSYSQMKNMRRINFFYNGFHWRIGSIAGVWIYSSYGYQPNYSGCDDWDDTLFEMKKAGYGFDIRRYVSDPNQDENCASTGGEVMAPAKQFADGTGYWVIRVATGKQLDRNYDPYKNLTYRHDVYRYNAKNNYKAGPDEPVPTE